MKNRRWKRLSAAILAAICVFSASAALAAETSLRFADSVEPEFTLRNLVVVARCFAGHGTLTAEQRAQFGLAPTGPITLTDLQQIARKYAAQMNGPNEPKPPEPALQYAANMVRGTITHANTKDSIWYITEVNGAEWGVLVGYNTILVDCATGDRMDVSALQTGTHVKAYLPAQAGSDPMWTACFAILLNVPTTGEGDAEYVRASEVTDGRDGAVVVMNQNENLLVTVPTDIPITVMGEPDKAAVPQDIKNGAQLIVWFDVVAVSEPASTTALRILIVPDDAFQAPQGIITSQPLPLDEPPVPLQ